MRPTILLVLSVLAACSRAQDNPPSQTPAIVRKDANVEPAALIKKVSPKYPKEARKKHVEGTVRLHCIIAKDGIVKDLEVVSGDPLLVDAALNAVRQWRYEPTKLEGKPVEVDTTIDVNFTLNKSP